MNSSQFLMVGVFLVFLTLKLTGQIDWSWWCVTLPLWGVLALIAVAALVAGVAAGVMSLVRRALAK